MYESEFKRERDFDNEEKAFSEVVRAGRRTYFFDVKKTRNEDMYISITESRKKVNADGSVIFDKHKIYVYKEDFDKFESGFSKALDFVRAALAASAVKAKNTSSVDIDFESL